MVIVMGYNYKRIYIILGIFLLVSVFLGGTLGYLQWNSQKTNIVFTVQDKFSCAADGGGNITSSDVVLAPTDCTNSDYAIKRELKVMPTLYDDLRIEMSLWLEVNDLGEGLSDSQNFRYALTTSDNSCAEGLVTEGNFNGKTVGDTITLLDSKSYSETTTDTYYLYVWLDKEETSTSTMNQSFDLSLNGSCVETPDKGVPTFEYTGDYEIVDDDDNVIEDPENWTDNWKIRFLTSGELTFTELNSAINGIDVFLVGGGGGGGAGGYTTTQTNISISINTDYLISIGAGGSAGSAGESTSAFDVVANGGGGGYNIAGGSGGSGGGGGGYSYDFYAGVGGSDGSAGNSGSGSGGLGQVTTTREFEDSTATIYAGGGGGGGAGGSNSNGVDGLINTGGGGGGGAYTKTGGSGGSGIVIIRNAR